MAILPDIGIQYLAVLGVFMGHERKYCYTKGDVGRLSGVSKRTLGRHIAEGKVDMEDLMSVMRYIIARRFDDGKVV